MSPKTPKKPKAKSQWSKWEWKEDLGKYRSYRWNEKAGKKEYRYQYSLMKNPAGAASTKDKSTNWSEWIWNPEQGVWISWRLNAAGELEEQPAEPRPPAPLDSNPADVPQIPAQAAHPSTTEPATVPVRPKEPEPVQDKVVPNTPLPESRPSGDVHHHYTPVNINIYENSFNQQPANAFDPYPVDRDGNPIQRYLPPNERRLPQLNRNRSYSSFRTHYIEDVETYGGIELVSDRRRRAVPEPYYGP